MEEILERLDIFLETQIIEKEDSEILKSWLQFILQKGYTDCDKLSTLFTHTAMVIHRIRQKENIARLTEEIIQQIYKSQNIEKAQELYSFIESKYKINEDEKDYILLHLCNLIG